MRKTSISENYGRKLTPIRSNISRLSRVTIISTEEQYAFRARLTAYPRTNIWLSTIACFANHCTFPACSTRLRNKFSVFLSMKWT